MKTTRASFLASLFFLTLLSLSSAFGESSFPTSPNQKITPGSLCDSGNTYRYPEHVRYCNRAVDSNEKVAVMKEYDQELGYSVSQMDRKDFKIDHYIPLCAGGSNDSNNLWPQHESVYLLTDPIEPAICEKMAAGRLKQADAMDLVRQAKANPADAATVLKKIKSL